MLASLLPEALNRHRNNLMAWNALRLCQIYLKFVILLFCPSAFPQILTWLPLDSFSKIRTL